MLNLITPLILTLNEAPNIERTLQRLAWAKDIVVVDSGSTDGTTAILKRYPNVRVFTRAFTTHAEQWNFGLRETGIDTDWVLALDADYVLTPKFADELRGLAPAADVDGFQARFRYCVDGRPLRGGLYPPVTVLFRRSRARFAQDGHTQRIQVPGRVENLIATVLHDDRKPLSRWFSSQIAYMRQEAEHLLRTPGGNLGLADRMRRLVVVAPVLVFFYCLIIKGNLLDGRRGVFYAMQRTVAEVILSVFIVEVGIHRRAQDG